MDLFQDWDRSFARLQKFRKRGKPLRGGCGRRCVI
jgi:hypothetical protein